MMVVTEGKKVIRARASRMVVEDISIILFMDIFIIDEYQIDQNIQGATSMHYFYLCAIHTFR